MRLLISLRAFRKAAAQMGLFGGSTPVPAPKKKKPAKKPSGQLGLFGGGGQAKPAAPKSPGGTQRVGVKTHQRRGKDGKVSVVVAHQSTRKKGAPKLEPGKFKAKDGKEWGIKHVGAGYADVHHPDAHPDEPPKMMLHDELRGHLDGAEKIEEEQPEGEAEKKPHVPYHEDHDRQSRVAAAQAKLDKHHATAQERMKASKDRDPDSTPNSPAVSDWMTEEERTAVYEAQQEMQEHGERTHEVKARLAEKRKKRREERAKEKKAAAAAAEKAKHKATQAAAEQEMEDKRAAEAEAAHAAETKRQEPKDDFTTAKGAMDALDRATAREAKPEAKPEAVKPSSRKRDDWGEKIGGARKDTYQTVSKSNLDDLEAEAEGLEASRLVTRDRVLGKHSWEDDEADGMTPAGSYLKREVMKLVAPKPADSPAARRDYVEACEFLSEGLSTCSTFDDVLDFMREWGSVFRYERDVGEVSPEEAIQGLTEGEHYISASEVSQIKQAQNKIWTAALAEWNKLPTRKEQLAAREMPRTLYKAAGLKPLPWGGVIGSGDRTVHLTKEGMAAKGWTSIERRKAEGGGHRHIAMEQHLRNRTSDDRIEPKPGETYRDAMKRRDAAFNAKSGITPEKLREEKDSHNVMKRMGEVLGNRFKRGALMRFNKSGRPSNFEDKIVPKAQTVDSFDEFTKKKSTTPRAPRPKGVRVLIGYRRNEKAERVGGASAPKDISEKTFGESFGLRAAEYGNWVSDDARGAHLKSAHEAMSDLADVLGLEQRHIGHGGTLAMAFGARGKGGRANAHYEPSRKVINLTHTRGGGTLAHEWGHFLDHMMSKAGANGTNLATRDPDTSHMHPKVSGALRELQATMMGAAGQAAALVRQAEKMRKDHNATPYRQRGRFDHKKYGDLHRQAATMKRKGASDFHQHSVNLDTDKNGRIAKRYWSDEAEQLARAFESYVEDKLHGQGRKSDYLVMGTRKPFGHQRHGKPSEPYPQGAERKAINAKFDKLFDALRDTGTLRKALAGGLFGAPLRTRTTFLIRRSVAGRLTR